MHNYTVKKLPEYVKRWEESQNTAYHLHWTGAGVGRRMVVLLIRALCGSSYHWAAYKKNAVHLLVP